MKKKIKNEKSHKKIPEVLQKANYILFGGQIFKLLVSYNGYIGRLVYACGLAVVITLICLLKIIHPLLGLMSLLLKLYCIPALIQKRCRSFNSKGTLYIISLFIFVLALELTYNVDLSVIPYAQAIFSIITWLFILTQLILLFRPTKNPADNKLKSFLTHLPIVTVISGICIIAGMLFIQYKYIPQTSAPSFRLKSAINEIYRHEYEYPEFCRHYGYEMINYPQQFRSQYYRALQTIEADQMKLLSRTIPNKYKSIKDFYESQTAVKSNASTDTSIHDFFENARKQIILIKIAAEENVPLQKLVWKDEYDSILGYKEACKVVDRNADFFLSLDCPFRHILTYVGLPTSCQYN